MAKTSSKSPSRTSPSPRHPRSEKPSRDRAFRTGLILFGLALVVRLLYLVESADSPTFEIPVVDAYAYHHAASRLAAGGGFDDTFFFQPFLYPFLLAGLLKVCASSIVAIKIIQALAGCCTVLLTFLLGRRIFGSGAGIIAGLIVALYGPLIYYEAELLATGLAAFFFVALLLLFLQSAETGKLISFFALGLCGGLAVLTRPTFLPLFLIGLVWLAFAIRRGKEAGPAMLRAVALVLLGFLVPALPVAFLNRHVTGHFGFLPSSGGLNMYVGNNPDFEKTVNARVGSQWSDVIDLPKRMGVRGDMWENQRFYYKQVKDFAFDELGAFVSGLSEKSMHFMSSREIPRNVDLYLFREDSSILSVLVWKWGDFGFPFGLIMPLAFLCIILSCRNMPVLLWLALLVYALSVIAVFVTARYRLPVIPVFAVLAGGGLYGLIRLSKKGEWRRLFGAAVFILCMLVFGVVPGPFKAETLDYRPELQCALGDSLQRQGRMDEAAKHFRKAVQLDPGYADAHNALGDLFIMQGKTQDAIKAYEKALKYKPDSAQAHCNIAALLTDLGRYDEAIAHCEAGLEVRPHEEAFCFNLARIYAEQRNFPAMKAQLEEVLARNPDHGPSHFELARQLEREGKFNEAISHYEKAAEQDQTGESKHFLAGKYFEQGSHLLRMGQAVQALEPLRRAAEITPTDTLVAHTLAVGLAKSGNAAEAVAQYHRVLKDWPNFVPSLAGLAWLRATHPDADIRDAHEAVTLAERCAKNDPSNPNVMNTLAAAYAESGRFDEAISTARKAIDFARANGLMSLVSEIESHLTLYEQGKPVRVE
jgi:tetratricopeptide (TPR) repeat protein